MKRQIYLYVAGFVALLILIGYILPERLVIPVKGANRTAWNHQTFWYEPWGKSVVHKRIDIFAKKGTSVSSATNGVVIYNRKLGIGGNVIAVLGPKWKIHFYTHLESIDVSIFDFVNPSQTIGTVGDSGNAKFRPQHVHYEVITLFPYFRQWDNSTQGWKKIFYLNPSEMLLSINA